MSYLLRYQYRVGDRDRYRETATMVMNDPEAGELMGRTVHGLEYAVLSESEGSWEVQCSRRLLEEAGPLTAHLPPDQRQDQIFRFRIRADGELQDLGQGLPSRIPQLPAERVEPGFSWETAGSRPDDGPPSVHFAVARAEERGGDMQVDLLATAEATRQDGSETVRTVLEGVSTFSVTRGKLLAAKTRLERTWSQGRQVVTAVELEPL